MAAWYKDVPELWNRPGDFFPVPEHTDDESFNAAVRLIVYCALAAAFVANNPRYLVFAVGAVGVLSVAHALGSRPDGELELDSSDPSEPVYDSRGSWTRPKRTAKCTRPTPDNPFMNYLPFDPPDKPPACPYDEVADEVWANFNRGLFKSPLDVYGWENAGAFPIQPVTTKIPDTEEFANAVYGPQVPRDKGRLARFPIRGTADQANPLTAENEIAARNEIFYR